MDVCGSSVQGGDLGINESVTLREIVNEARERAMHERMERMEKKIETLTIILHKLRNEQRGTHGEMMRSDGVTPGHVNRKNNGEGTTLMRGRSTGRPSGGLGDQSLWGGSQEGRNQSPGRQNTGNNDRAANVERGNFDNTRLMSRKSETR